MSDIITPGASTVAKFKTIMHFHLRDSSVSQKERQVNAFLLCRASLPTLPLVSGIQNHMKVRRELRLERNGFEAYKCLYAKTSTAKLYYFPVTGKRNGKKNSNKPRRYVGISKNQFKAYCHAQSGQCATRQST